MRLSRSASDVEARWESEADVESEAGGWLLLHQAGMPRGCGICDD